MKKLLSLYIWYGALHAAEIAPPLPTDKRIVDVTALVSLLATHQSAHTIKNQLGENYLHFACRTRNPGMVELLLNHNFYLHEQDTWGRTALYYALRSEYDAAQSGLPKIPSLALLLLERGHCSTYCEPKYTPLMYAALFGLPAVAYKLLQLGAPVNSIEVTSKCTALTLAAQQNKPAIAQLLLRYGAYIDTENPVKTVPEWAIEWQSKGQPELLHVLQATQPNARLALGINPLIFLAHREFKPVRYGKPT